jgi:hypothetical protein
VATAFPHATGELWATDAHRSGLKPLLKRVWTLPGQRPLAPGAPRYQWRYLVAFGHPASGRTVWQLATGVSAELFSAELAAFAEAVGARPTTQIVLVLDRAGGHTGYDVVVPEHVHPLLFLPPHAPELQPCEHRWQLSDAPLVNRHFRDLDELEEVQLARCAQVQAQRDRIRSATLFHWWPKRVKKRQGPRRT